MQFLNPTNDVAFKKIFGSEEHKSVTLSFLNAILEYAGNKVIVDVTFLNTEQKGVTQEKKDNILDILCIDQAGNRYIVEVQVERVKAFDKRMVYYGAKTYAMQLGKKQSYHKLTPVIVVAILDFTMFPHKKNYKSIHKLLDDKTYEHDLHELSFAFVELPKFVKKEHELVTNEEKWLYFIKWISKKDHVPAPLDKGEFEEACHAAERMTWTEEELNAYDDAIVRATDIQGSLELAVEEKVQRIAIDMLNANIDIETIIQITHLSAEQIEALRKKN